VAFPEAAAAAASAGFCGAAGSSATGLVGVGTGLGLTGTSCWGGREEEEKVEPEEN